MPATKNRKTKAKRIRVTLGQRGLLFQVIKPILVGMMILYASQRPSFVLSCLYTLYLVWEGIPALLYPPIKLCDIYVIAPHWTCLLPFLVHQGYLPFSGVSWLIGSDYRGCWHWILKTSRFGNVARPFSTSAPHSAVDYWSPIKLRCRYCTHTERRPILSGQVVMNSLTAKRKW